jgi:hypothetical protein
MFGTSFSTGFGGKGANQAVMAAKLGAGIFLAVCDGGHELLISLWKMLSWFRKSARMPLASQRWTTFAHAV